ncbi:MAG: hypothetical protein LBQ91_01330 [Oscillospiraceae bacterium]|jgi:hypothetical protein|nr:hypothetical protein [Oscillospiraceae bacterium]
MVRYRRRISGGVLITAGIVLIAATALPAVCWVFAGGVILIAVGCRVVSHTCRHY